MRSELQVIIKMVEEVVKPLLTIKDSLESTQGDFGKVQGELSAVAYQLIALYDFLEKESKVITQRNIDLEGLGKRFNKGLQLLEAWSEKIDQSIQAGIKLAANDLKQAVQEQVRAGLQAEVNPAVRSLREAVNKSQESLNTYEAITWTMHIKILIIAIVCGALIGVSSFFALSRKIDRLRCQCLCVLKPEEAIMEKKQEVKEPLSLDKPQPQNKAKKLGRP